MSIKKLKIAVIGSTGSVGKNTLEIIKENPDYFKIDLLVCNSNTKLIIEQLKLFLPKYVFINNYQTYEFVRKIKYRKKIIFIKNFEELKKLKLSFDKTVLAAPSLEGLKYSFLFMKFSKELLIANKESIVCGGNILMSQAKKFNCKIISIDSEHYCIERTIATINPKEIDTVYLTASGGPFLGKNKNFYNKSSIKVVTKHPKWKMGKKISVDSATMVNKLFELVEAHILFKIPIKKIKIKIHKESLVHSAVILKDGLVKIIMHDTSMKIPIRNSLFSNRFFSQKNNYFKSNKNIILTFDEKSLTEFEILKNGYKILNYGHSAWIIFNVVNDFLVNEFIKNRIFFYQIVKNLNKILLNKNIIFYAKKKIRSLSDINKCIHFAQNFIENYEVK